MAIGDITRNVVTKYKADVSDHRRSIGELKKSLNELAADEEKAAKSREKSLGDHVAGLSKVVGAIAGAKLAFDGYKLVVEETRLRTAATGVDIGKLSAAAGGLKTNMQLLSDAAKLNASKFKLTSEQMVIAEQAMRQFTRAGFDQEEASKKVLDAIVKLEGDGLKDFGVRVRSATTDADKFTSIMEALAGEAKKVEGTTTTNAESMSKLGVSFQNSFDMIKTSIGEVVVEMAPLIASVAELIALMSKASKALLADVTPDGFWTSGRKASQEQLDQWKWTSRPGQRQLVMNSTEYAKLGVGGAVLKEYSAQFGGVGRLIADEFTRTVAERSRGGRGPGKALAESPISGITTEAGAGPGAFSGGLGASDGWSVDVGGSMPFDSSKWIGNRDTAGEYAEFNRNRGDSDNQLEKMFGPLDQISGYQLAFEGLQGAVSSALGAWIDGSATAGEAIKRFLAEAMKSNALLMAAEAVKEGAYALASLAWGNVAKAGAHGLAALKFGAASAAFAIGARAMGGGGSGGGGAGAAASVGSYSRASSADSRPVERTIVIGNGFVDGGPRQRQLYATRLVEAAITSGAVTYSS